jgi:LysW-gamma-L-lysine carboxypeptidase
MVAYGPGDAALDHTPHEHLSAVEFRTARSVLEVAVRNWLTVRVPEAVR